MRAEAFPADAGLPALGAACDARRMEALLRRHLRPRGGMRLEGCALEGFRHRRGARGVIKYRLGASAGAGAAPVTSYATGVLYGAGSAPGRAEELAGRLADAAAGWDAPAELSPFEPVAFLPELEMLVQVYPFDRRLPALARLAGGPTPELAGLLAEHAGLDDPPGATWTSEPARYRPHLGAVLRYTLAGQRAGGEAVRRTYYVKIAAEHAAAEWGPAPAELGAPPGGFALPVQVAELPDLGATVLEELPGVPLDRLLVRGGPVGEPLRVIARALVLLNESQAPSARRFGPADEIAGLERAAATLDWARPDLQASVARICGAVAARVGDVPLAPTHRDLKPDHVLLDGGRAGLIDLGSFALADPVLDPATLLARLFGLPFEQPLSRRRASGAMSAFEDEYFARVPRAWRARLEPHYAGALIELAASLFRRQVPGWSEAVTRLVAEAAAATGR